MGNTATLLQHQEMRKKQEDLQRKQQEIQKQQEEALKQQEIKKEQELYDQVGLWCHEILIFWKIFVPASKTCFAKNMKYRISSYSFRGNHSFLNLEIQRVQHIRQKVPVHKGAETIQGRKLFEAETIRGNTVNRNLTMAF